MKIPERLAFYCRRSVERSEWLLRLPRTVAQLAERWALAIDDPFDGDDVSCSWVAPATLGDGSRAVLKIGMPHMEAEHELHGLLFWNGDAAVRVLAHDEASRAMLLERCQPGASLNTLPEPEQDVVISGLLRRLWRDPVAPHPFRPLSAMLAHWSAETIDQVDQWPDATRSRRSEVLRRTAPHGDLSLALTDLVHAREGLEDFAERSEAAHENLLRALRDRSGADFREGRTVTWEDVKARNKLCGFCSPRHRPKCSASSARLTFLLRGLRTRRSTID